MKLDVLDIEGGTTGRHVELAEEVFGIEPNEHVVYLAVKQYLANQRQGTHSSKGRSQVAGSTRKIKKQKGTGTARAGDIKNPLFRGGGRMFGPKPRDYSFKVNRKVKDLARRSALSAQAAKGNLKVVEDFTFDAPKTRQLSEVFKNLSLAGRKVLLVTPDHESVLLLSGRNIPGAKVMRASDLSTYDVLNAGTLLLAESSVAKLNELQTSTAQ